MYINGTAVVYNSVFFQREIHYRTYLGIFIRLNVAMAPHEIKLPTDPVKINFVCLYFNNLKEWSIPTFGRATTLMFGRGSICSPINMERRWVKYGEIPAKRSKCRVGSLAKPFFSSPCEIVKVIAQFGWFSQPVFVSIVPDQDCDSAWFECKTLNSTWTYSCSTTGHKMFTKWQRRQCLHSATKNDQTGWHCSGFVLFFAAFRVHMCNYSNMIPKMRILWFTQRYFFLANAATCDEHVTRVARNMVR